MMDLRHIAHILMQVIVWRADLSGPAYTPPARQLHLHNLMMRTLKGLFFLPVQLHIDGCPGSVQMVFIQKQTDPERTMEPSMLTAPWAIQIWIKFSEKIKHLNKNNKTSFQTSDLHMKSNTLFTLRGPNKKTATKSVPLVAHFQLLMGKMIKSDKYPMLIFLCLILFLPTYSPWFILIHGASQFIDWANHCT